MGTRVWISGAALLVATVVGVAPASAQDDGLVEEGSTTWTVRPGRGKVTASIELRLRNTVPDTPRGRTYFDGYGIALPMPAQDVTVRVEGQEVDPDLTPLEDGTAGVRWSFPDRLYVDEVQTWTVEATFASVPPRTDLDQGPRITPSFVLVPIWAWGPDGAELDVRVPAAMDARLGFADPDRTRDGVDLFRRDDATDFAEFLVGASDQGERRTEEVAIGDTTVVVEAWSDDPRWGRRMGRFARRALPALADWTSTPWPEDTLTIRETARPVAEGWGGWNDPEANEISVGEDFDDALWTHELAHNWIDETQFSEPWLREGLAEVVTATLADELGIADPPRPDPSDRALEDWDDVLAGADRALLDDAEGWYETTGDLYAGAQFVVGSIAAEVGEDPFREMVRMTLQDESAWGDTGSVPIDPAADWREFLDLAERIGGSTTARRLILQRVTPGSSAVIERRDTAADRFAEVEADPWGPPHAIVAAMHGWEFDRAEELIATAVGVRQSVDDLAGRATDLGLAVPDLQALWTDARFDVLQQQVVAIDAVLDDVVALADDADAAGLAPPDLQLDATSDTPDRMAVRVATLRRAITWITATERAVTAAQGDAVAAIGLVGSDPDDVLDDARTAFVAGDVEGVSRATSEVDDLLDAATRRGQLRVAAAALAVLVLVLVVVALVRRRRHAPDATWVG